MALIQTNYFSPILRRVVSFNACIPAEKNDGPLRSIILLHDFGESCDTWLARADIQSLAEQFGAAVIMPSDENHFYVNDYRMNDLYVPYIGREIPLLCQDVFPLSTKQDDRAIAGWRVGGYGSLRIGLECADTIGTIISADPALVTDKLTAKTEQYDPYGLTRRDYSVLFGDFSAVAGGENDPFSYVEQAKQSGRILPAIGLISSPGAEDAESCNRFADILRQTSTASNFLENKPIASRRDFLDALADGLKRMGW